MSGAQNWGPQATPEKYFSDQAKRAAMSERRPRPAKAADLVGPGIGPTARPITDLNDPLALFNGYFTAEMGVLNGPNVASPMVIHVQMDAVNGGVQSAYPINFPGVHYERVVVRGVADPDTLSFLSGWRRIGSPPMAALHDYTLTGLASFTPTPLIWGAIDVDRSTLDYADWFISTGGELILRKSGLYRLSVRVMADQDIDWVTWLLTLEQSGAGLISTLLEETNYHTIGRHADMISLDFIAPEDNCTPIFTVRYDTAPIPPNVTLTAHSITRIGEADPAPREPLVVTDLGSGMFQVSGDGVTRGSANTFTVTSEALTLGDDDDTYTVTSE